MTTSRRKVAEIELREIDLSLPEDASGINAKSIQRYLGSLLPTVKVQIRPSLLRGLGGSKLEEYAKRLASSRVKDLTSSTQSYEPMYGEIDYERRAILGKAKLGGVVYDGRKVEAIYLDLVKDKSSLERCFVVFTERLLSTYSWDDRRHHLRTVVFGFPSVISIPGVVEAPAKPREYYVLRQQLEAAGAGEVELIRLKSAFKGRFIEHGDPSVNEILKGMALQAVMFHMTLDPFCKDPKCRLYNAHWQEDLISSQLTSSRLCSRHKRLVRELGRHPKLDW